MPLFLFFIAYISKKVSLPQSMQDKIQQSRQRLQCLATADFRSDSLQAMQVKVTILGGVRRE